MNEEEGAGGPDADSREDALWQAARQWRLHRDPTAPRRERLAAAGELLRALGGGAVDCAALAATASGPGDYHGAVFESLVWLFVAAGLRLPRGLSGAACSEALREWLEVGTSSPAGDFPSGRACAAAVAAGAASAADGCTGATLRGLRAAATAAVSIFSFLTARGSGRGAGAALASRPRPAASVSPMRSPLPSVLCAEPPPPAGAGESFAALLLRIVRHAADAAWRQGDAVGGCALPLRPSLCRQLVAGMPRAVAAVRREGGEAAAERMLAEWAAACGSVARLCATGAPPPAAVPIGGAAAAAGLAVAAQRDGEAPGGALPPGRTPVTWWMLDAALDAASQLAAPRSGEKELQRVAAAVALVEAALSWAVVGLPHGRALVDRFERRGGYPIVSQLLHRLGEEREAEALPEAPPQLLLATAHLPLVLLGLSRAPALSQAAVEGFAARGTAALVAGQAFDWQRAEQLPWCSGQAFGLLMHSFSACRGNRELRRLLLCALLYALLSFPQQYLKQTHADALWCFQPLMAVAADYHHYLDVGMQELFLGAVQGLACYALARPDEADAPRSAPGRSLAFDLRCVVKLLTPPERQADFHCPAAGWWIEGMLRLLRTVGALQRAAGGPALAALRQAGLCERLIALLASGFGRDDRRLVCEALQVLQVQLRGDPQSSHSLLASCHDGPRHLYALYAHRTQQAPPGERFPYMGPVSRVLELLAACSAGGYDAVGDLLGAAVCAPGGSEPPCPHCVLSEGRSPVRKGSRAWGDIAASAVAEPPPLTANCRHWDFFPRREPTPPPPQPPVDAAGAELERLVGAALLRRGIAELLLRLLCPRSRGAAAEAGAAGASCAFGAARGLDWAADSVQRDAARAEELWAALPAHGECEAQSAAEQVGEMCDAERVLGGAPADPRRTAVHLVSAVVHVLSVVTAAAVAHPSTADSLGASGLVPRVAPALRRLARAAPPAAACNLGAALCRLALLCAALPPGWGTDAALGQLHRPPGVRCRSLPTDRSALWWIRHAPAAVGALSAALPAGDGSGFAARAAAFCHLAELLRRLAAKGSHNALALHRAGLVSWLWANAVPLASSARDPQLTEAVFELLATVGTVNCTTQDAYMLFCNARDPYLSEHVMRTLRALASGEPNGYPHHFLSFSTAAARVVDPGCRAPLAELPQLCCSPWPCAGAGHTFAVWLRFAPAVRAGPELSARSVVLISHHVRDDDHAHMAVDVQLEEASPPSRGAQLRFRVAVRHEDTPGEEEEASAVPTGLLPLAPGEWHHLCVRHSIRARGRYLEQAFDVLVDGGTYSGSEGHAVVRLSLDRRERLQKMARKGGTLVRMQLGAPVELPRPAESEAASSSAGAYPRAAEQCGGGGSGCDTSESEGSPRAAPLPEGPAGGHFASFELASLTYLWGTLTPWEAHLLYALGSDYCGDLKESLAHYHTPAVLSHRACRRHPEDASRWLAAAVGAAEGPIERYASGALGDEVFLVVASRACKPFAAARVIFGPRPRGPRPGEGSEGRDGASAAPSHSGRESPQQVDDSDAASSQEGADSASRASVVRRSGAQLQHTVYATGDTSLPLHAVSLALKGPVSSVQRSTLKGNLRAVGGVHAVISLISTLETQAARQEALWLLVDLAAASPQNAHAMATEGGLLALGWYLQRERVAVDARVLDACFALCGVCYRGAPDAGPDGVLCELNAVRTLLLDWGIWSRAQPAVQGLLLTRLRDLIRDHPAGRAHRAALVLAGAPAWVLRLTCSRTARGPLLPVALRPEGLHAMSALAGVEEGPGAAPCPGAFRALSRHLFSTTYSGAALRPADVQWRLAWLCLWVLLLARCSEPDARTLVADRGADLLVGLVADPSGRARFLLLLGIAALMRFPAPRQALLAAEVPNMLLHQYTIVASKPPWAGAVDSLNTADPSAEELLLLLTILVRGPAGEGREGAAEWSPAVTQPLLPLLFLDAFDGLLEEGGRGLDEDTARALLTSALEALAASRPGRRASAVGSLHSCPREVLTRGYFDNSAQLSGLHGSLGEELAAAVGSLREVAGQEGHSAVGRPAALPPAAVGEAGLAVPELLGPLALLGTAALAPRPPDRAGPLQAANLRFKRRLVVDALHEVFVNCTAAGRAQFLERGVHLACISMLQPRVSRSDPLLSRLLLRLIGAAVAWGCVEAYDTVSVGITGTAEPPWPGLLEGVLDAVSVQFRSEAQVSRTVSRTADVGWVHHIQQHILHAALLAFQPRLAGGAPSPATLAAFAAYAEVAADTLAGWRAAPRPGAPEPTLPRLDSLSGESFASPAPLPVQADGPPADAAAPPGLRALRRAAPDSPLPFVAVLAAAAAPPGARRSPSPEPRDSCFAAPTPGPQSLSPSLPREASPPGTRGRSNATKESSVEGDERCAGDGAAAAKGGAVAWVLPPPCRAGEGTRLAAASPLIREELAFRGTRGGPGGADGAPAEPSPKARGGASPRRPRSRTAEPSPRGRGALHRSHSSGSCRDRGAAADGPSVLPQEMLAAIEDPRAFPFWLTEAVQLAVARAAAQAPGSLPLAARIASRLSSSAEAALQRLLRRLVLELLTPFPRVAQQPLLPSSDACCAFGLAMLLHTLASGTERPDAPASAAGGARGGAWCARWWTPAAEEVDPRSLLAVYVTRDPDREEPSFTQLVLYHTLPLLRERGGALGRMLLRTWRYLVETRTGVVRKAVSAGVFPELGQGRSHGRSKRGGPSAPKETIVSLLGTALGPGLRRPRGGGSPAREDRLWEPGFIGRIVRHEEAALARARQRGEQRAAAARTGLVEASLLGRAHKLLRKRALEVGKVTRGSVSMAGEAVQRALRQGRQREKDALGVVGRLVRSRLLLQDLWGPASAIYTRREVLQHRWRLDDVEGPDRMRVRLRRFFARPLIEQLGLVGGSGDAQLQPGQAQVGAAGAAPEGSPAEETDDDELYALLAHQFDPGLNPAPTETSAEGARDGLPVRHRRRGAPERLPCAQITPMERLEGELFFYPQALHFVSNDSPYRDDLEPAQQPPAAAPAAAAAAASKGPGAAGKAEGARLVREMHLHAVRHRATMWYAEVSGVFRRRYLLVNNSLEVFTEHGLALFFAFDSEQVRDRVYQDILDECPRAREMSLTAENLKRWRDHWQQGRMSNFQYLMWLNTMAGRSFNDLTQYPVFPHVIADYSSEQLDLRSPATFRDLTLPMGAQTEERREKVRQKFEQTMEIYRMNKGEDPPLPGPVRKKGGGFLLRLPDLFDWLGRDRQREAEEPSIDLLALPPHHHGSHFSNRATVLYYCVRLQPFSDYFCELNGLKLDVPDRTFHSAAQAWRLSSSVSTSDVKELTPEFFYLPEFLVNANRIRFGIKQDRTLVDAVVLPPWAGGSPRLFVQTQRRALESEHVSRLLHHWIDLVFGYKLSGEPAIEALNCFHPYAYEGAVNVDSIPDPVLRQSTIDIINNFGQMPEQLFTRPHPRRDVERVFGDREAPWWQVGRPQRRLHAAAAEGGGGLAVTRSEVRKGVVRSIRVDTQSVDSATTRGFDTVAEEDADDEVFAAADCRLILLHSASEAGGLGSGAAVVDRTPAECLQFLQWDNSVRIYQYENGRQGREVLALRQSSRADTFIVAATSRGGAQHIAFGTDCGTVEVYRYGSQVAPSGGRRRAGRGDPSEGDEAEGWHLPGDSQLGRDARGLLRLPLQQRGGAGPTPPAAAAAGAGGAAGAAGATLRATDHDDGRRRTLRHLASLHGHRSAVHHLCVSKEFNIIASAGGDGMLILWDLIDLVFIRAVCPAAVQWPEQAPADGALPSARAEAGAQQQGTQRVAMVEVNPLTGDVLCFWGPGARGPTSAGLFSVNLAPVASRRFPTPPYSLLFCGPALFVGTERGRILCLSASDLSDLGPTLQLRCEGPVTALAGNERRTKLFSAHQVINAHGAAHSVICTWSAAPQGK
eukprot:TRINITY_DN4463_c1_g1_i1.p1 TRINITY_DN4463_c1_g1~~TRINITY_DN4463_c1_g1_i1.p1  ORF type:complete len:3921 (+),score=1138.99 TRINITY_DN4463_c1_g1_i1:91-11853(+)